MPAGLSLSVDVLVTNDVTAPFMAAMRQAMEPAALAGARKFLERAEARLTTQSFPGPPLAESTIRRKEAALAAAGLSTSNAETRWKFFDVAIREAGVISYKASENVGVGDIVPPEDTAHPRPASLYWLLEFGGVNGAGHFVPGRKLLSTTAEQDLPVFVEAMKAAVNTELAGAGL